VTAFPESMLALMALTGRRLHERQSSVRAQYARAASASRLSAR
jgi:hypothetical protein